MALAWDVILDHILTSRYPGISWLVVLEIGQIDTSDAKYKQYYLNKLGQALLMWSIGPYWKPVFKGTIILQLPDQPWG